MRLRVVAADDSAAWLHSLTGLLDAQFDVVATVSDGSAALERIREFKPEVAVLDLEMPGLERDSGDPGSDEGWCFSCGSNLLRTPQSAAC